MGFLMTLSGQGLNFTFLLKANGKQNKKAVQTSVNLEKNWFTATVHVISYFV